MLPIFLMLLARGFAEFSLDESSASVIKPNSKLNLIKASCPGTGYVYYLLSENDKKLQVEDVDGMYISGQPGYQNFTVKCTNLCVAGDQLQLSLILKRPWEDKLSVMKTINLQVVEK